MDSLKKKARIAGVLYLLLAITSTFGLVYVPSKIILHDNILATVNNIIHSQTLFRMGILSNCVYLTIFVFLVLAFYNLFKDVNKKLSSLMVSLVLVAIPVAFVNQIIQAAVLILLGGDTYVKAFEAIQLNALVQLFLTVYEYGNYMVMLFWGLWLFPLGILVIKSKFIPKIFGILLIIGCIGYIIPSITFMMSPDYGRIIFPISTLPSAVAEISIILWLLIKGVREQK